MSEDLKACPFCGSTAHSGKHKNGWYVECDVPCGGVVGFCKTEEEAIEDWQDRPIEDALRAEIENKDRMIVAYGMHDAARIQDKQFEINELRAENDELQGAFDKLKEDVCLNELKAHHAEKENERLRKALEFYANKENWEDQQVISKITREIRHYAPNATVDQGDIASNALKGGDK